MVSRLYWDTLCCLMFSKCNFFTSRWQQIGVARDKLTNIHKRQPGHRRRKRHWWHDWRSQWGVCLCQWNQPMATDRFRLPALRARCCGCEARSGSCTTYNQHSNALATSHCESGQHKHPYKPGSNANHFQHSLQHGPGKQPRAGLYHLLPQPLEWQIPNPSILS